MELPMNLTRRLVLGFAVALAALTCTPTAKAQNGNNWDVFVLDEFIYNTCTEEWIHFEGFVYTQFDFRSDGSGGLHINFQFRASADGIGLSSGRRYAINNSAHETDHISGNNGQYSLTFTQNWKLISQGSAENGRIKDTFHFTLNANGDVTADFYNFVYDPCIYVRTKLLGA
jgi:hypothetical protein